MPQIQLANTTLEVLLLGSDEEFDDWYEKRYRLSHPPPISADYTRADYESEKAESETRLKLALSQYWTDGEEFEVAWDENDATTLCGSIYHSRIVCREYLQIVHDVLQATRRKDLWFYHTAMELSDGVEINDVVPGEFIILQNHIAVNADPTSLPAGFGFIKYFSRTRAEAAAGGHLG